MTFETIMVDTQPFISIFIYHAIKYTVIGSVVLTFIATRFGKTTFEATLLQIIKFYWLIFKTTSYILLFLLVFFYNPSTGSLELHFPSSMLLSSLFVGVLAFYEVMISFLDLIE